MKQEQGASARADRAATPSEPSQSSVVSGVAGIPCAFTLEKAASDAVSGISEAVRIMDLMGRGQAARNLDVYRNNLEAALRLKSELEEAPADLKPALENPLLRIADAARQFVQHGSRVTQIDGRLVHQIVERDDKSDPHYALCQAVVEYDESVSA